MGRGGWLARSRRKIRGEYERNSVEQKRKLSVWEEERLGVASAVAGEREEDGSERSSHRAGSSHDSRYKTILIGRTMRVGLWGGSVVGAERVDHGALCSLRPVKLFIVPRSSLSLSLSLVLSFLLSFLFPSSALTDLSVPFPLPFRPSLRRSFFLFFPETPDNYCRLLVCNSLDAQFYYRFPPTCTLPTLPPSCSRNLRSWSRLSISYLG